MKQPRQRSDTGRAVILALGILVAAVLVFIGVYGAFVRDRNAVCREGYRATIGLSGVFCAQGYVP